MAFISHGSCLRIFLFSVKAPVENAVFVQILLNLFRCLQINYLHFSTTIKYLFV